MKDLYNNVKLTRGLSPVVKTTDNTAWVSQIADTAGFESLMFAGIIGTLTDADMTVTFLAEEGDDSALADAATVASASQLGSQTIGIRYDSDNQTFKWGYRGTKRYVRVTLTPAANTGDVYFAGIWVHGHPKTAPQTTQLVSGQ